MSGESSKRRLKFQHQAYLTAKYKDKVHEVRNELFKEYVKNQSHPERHPAYEKEWKKFWERRFDEVKKEGKTNPLKYDYKSDWAIFWVIRMKELFEEQFKKEKRDIRRKLGLSSSHNLDSEIDSDSLTTSSPETASTKSHRRTRRRRREKSVDSKRSAKRSKTTSTHAYEELNTISSTEDSQNGTSTSRDEGKSSHVPEYSDLSSPSLSESEPVSMIIICRMLVNEKDDFSVKTFILIYFQVALETELGSLAPKALDLLANTIEVYKQSSDDADEKLMTKENTILLEVIKEKMKGLLIVEIYSTHKTFAIKNLVQKIDQLIHQTNVAELPQEKAKLSKDLPKEENVNRDKDFIEDITKVFEAHRKKKVSSKEIAALIEMFVDDEMTDAPKISSSSTIADIEHFSDDDLKLLLANFHDLLKDEQSKIIRYLEELEKTDSSRVQLLRQYFGEKVDKSETSNEVIDVDDDDECSEVFTKAKPATFKQPLSILNENFILLDKRSSDPKC